MANNLNLRLLDRQNFSCLFYEKSALKVSHAQLICIGG